MRSRGVGLALVLSGGLTACGGGVPLLYPARTLPTGDVRASSGMSANIIVGSLASDVTAAQSQSGGSTTVITPTYAKGAMVLAAVAPGLAPYEAARVGVGNRFEGGIAYTGRAGHIDVRRSFDWGDTSLSVGLGATVPFFGDRDTSTLAGVDLSALNGYGADVPVLVGWQSAARVYMGWVGARAGWDHVNISAETTEPGSPTVGAPNVNLSADRYYGGGVAGFAAGFRHIHAALELDVAYQSVSGNFGGTSATASGLSIAPAAALWLTF